MIRKAALSLTAVLAVSGCASVAVLGGLAPVIEHLVIAQSLTVQPPGGSQQPTVFLLSPTEGIKGITRDQVTNCSANCTKTFSGQSTLTDTSVSADSIYDYTITFSDGSTRSRYVEPLDVPTQQLNLTSPGESPLQVGLGAPPSVNGNGIQFKWQDIRKQSGFAYGYYIVVGKEDFSKGTGIDPVYSAFLDESLHPSSVQYGQTTDLGGFAGQLLQLVSSSAPSFTATSASGSLAAGIYVWTLVPIQMNSTVSVDASTQIPADVSYALGTLPNFSKASNQYLEFQVQ